jgi:hypothetical protein
MFFLGSSKVLAVFYLKEFRKIKIELNNQGDWKVY